MSQPNQGRPRDSKTTERIIKAATAQILEGGLDALNYEALAVTAETSRTTIYRRWPTKLDLGIDVMESLAVIGTKPDSGDLVADLTEHCMQATNNHKVIAASAKPSEIWRTVLHPEIARIYADRVGKYRRLNGLAIIADGVSRGELPANVDGNQILDALAGYVFFINVYSHTQVSVERVANLAESLVAAPPLLIQE